MAFNLQNMTVDYKSLMGLIPAERAQLAQSGQINDIISALTPGQLVNMFPRYYREQLPDVGQINQYTPSLDVALSGGSAPGPKYKPNIPGKDFYSSIYPEGNVKTTLSPEQKAIYELFDKAGVGRGENAAAAGVEGIEEGRPQRMKMAYDAFAAAGFSHKQALALTAEVGRENGFQEKYMFGTHSDPYNSATNLGMLSMQGPRLKALKEFLMSEGRFGTDGQLIPDQETMNSMARFYMNEMKTTEKSKFTEEFLENPDIDPGRAAYLLGSESGYIRWRYSDPKYAHHHEYRDQYYNEIDDITQQYIKRVESVSDDVKELETVITKFDPAMIGQLDERLQTWYENASEGQKQKFQTALQKLGVDQFNETMKKQPVTSATLGAVTAVPLDETRVKESQAGFRQLPIKPELRNALEFAAEKSGLYVDIFSGGQDKEIHDAMEASGKNSSYRHNVDIKGIPGAADVILHVRDKNGKLVPLSVTNPEHAPYIAAFTENFSRVVPSAGVGANYMLSGNQVDPRKIHYGGPNAPGAPPATWGSMPGYLQEAHARGVAARAEDLKNDVDPLKQWEIEKQKQKEEKLRAEAEAKAQADPVAATENKIETANSAPPALATGGTIPPGENIAGVNMDTGNIEFVANDRERIRVDPATLENVQQPAMITPEDTQRLQAPVEPQETRRPQSIPQDMSDPKMFEDMVVGYAAMPPSQVRATNRAKLYGDDSGGFVNGHFA